MDNKKVPIFASAIRELGWRKGVDPKPLKKILQKVLSKFGSLKKIPYICSPNRNQVFHKGRREEIELFLGEKFFELLIIFFERKM